MNFAFVGDFGFFSYLVIFMLLAISGLGLAFSEEALLLFIGYLSYKGILLLPLAIVVAFLGVLAADSLSFHFGRRILKMFPKILRWRPGIKSKASAIRKKLRDARYVFVSRFIPNVRMLVPIAAGMYGISWRKFFRCNVFAAALFVPILIALGLYAGPQIQWLVSVFARFAEIFFVVLGIVALFYLTKLVRSRPADAE